MACRQVILEGGWCEKFSEQPDLSSIVQWFHFTHQGVELKQFHKLFFCIKFNDGLEHNCFFNVLESDAGIIDRHTLVSITQWYNYIN
jgi:hypothetical protein